MGHLFLDDDSSWDVPHGKEDWPCRCGNLQHAMFFGDDTGKKLRTFPGKKSPWAKTKAPVVLWSSAAVVLWSCGL